MNAVDWVLVSYGLLPLALSYCQTPAKTDNQQLQTINCTQPEPDAVMQQWCSGAVTAAATAVCKKTSQKTFFGSLGLWATY